MTYALDTQYDVQRYELGKLKKLYAHDSVNYLSFEEWVTALYDFITLSGDTMYPQVEEALADLAAVYIAERGKLMVPDSMSFVEWIEELYKCQFLSHEEQVIVKLLR